MLEKVVVDLTDGRIGLFGAVFRYEVLDRLAKTAGRHGVEVLAFGFGRAELRLLLDGEERAITNTLRGLKVGTKSAARRWGLTLRSRPSTRSWVDEDELLEVVRWIHCAPIEVGASSALASP